jgi:membrane protein YdbS with pleckstrin-like domain
MGYAEKNLAPGETILLRAHYHWVFYRFSIIVIVLAIALALASLSASRSQAADEVGKPLLWVAAGFVVIALLAFVGRRIRAHVDEYVVTNRRIIRRVGLFSREIQQAPLEKIQDITIEQGFLGRLLDYGTVIVETASEKGMLVFPAIASPEGIRNHVFGQSPPVSEPAEVPEGASAQTRARLQELESLKAQGLVSVEEYAAKRQEILSHL